ncbi:syntaxin-4-like [Musca autumnalis]|uniref:syntaxin-4-like n=1 Tax=Musca autumnalis TaxID=221902 RepID=UPI003CE8AEBA
MVKDRLKELKNIEDVSEVDGVVRVDFEVQKGPSFIEPLIKLYSEILSEFEEMRTNTDTLKSMLEAQNAHLFNEDEFNKVRQQNLKLSNRIIGRFKKLESKLPKEKDFRTKARMQRALYYGYFHLYALLWERHEEIHQKYDQQLRKNLQTQSKILNYNLTEEEIETLIEHGQVNLLMGNILADTEATKKQLQDLENRLDELLKLEKSISEVHGLFLRLQNVVVEQGEIMQRIETHFENACEYVGEGARQIKIAAALRQQTVAKKAKLIIIGSVLLVILLLIIINSIHCFMFCKKK